MIFDSIEVSKLKNKPKFSLCLPLPYRNKISNLVDITNVTLNMSLGKIHELSFDMPFRIDMDNELVKNPLIDKFDAYYQVKMEWNDTVEYFVYINGNRKLDNNGRNISYKLYSSAYLLTKTPIRSYEETSKSLSFHAREFLAETNWTIGFVDGDFDLKYREMSISESNVLQSIYDLGNKFDAVVVFDNVNLKVSFFKAENLGFNKGLTLKPTTFIESLGYEIDYDQIVTRLSVYGSDGLEFRRLSPTGTNFIESLNWFIIPYEEDEQGNVIKHSKWLSDGLCHNYIAYQEKINRLTPTFKNLTNNRTDKQDEIIQEEQELSNLQNTLNQIENAIWVINKTYFEEAVNRADWQREISRKNETLALIERQTDLILNLTNQLDAIDLQIDNLRNEVAKDNPSNFTVEQLREMNDFIHWQSYTNDSIIDEQDLLDDGNRAFQELSKPPLTVTMGLINFLNEVEHSLIRDRISLGDTVKVKSEELDVYFQLKIIGINYNISNDTITLTISNLKDLKNDATKFLDTLKNATSTSSTVNMDRFKWNEGTEAKTLVNEILNSAFDAGKNAIFGGFEDTTILDKYGLKSVQSGDPNTFLVINNGVMAITNDGGNSIQVAITKDGVHAIRLVGKIIIGERLFMEDENGIWDLHGSTATIYDRNGRESMYIGQIDRDCFGIRMDNAKHRINLSTCDGFKISKYLSGGSLEDVLIADLEGNFYSKYWTHDTTVIKDSKDYFELDDNMIVIKDGGREVMRMGYIPSMSFGGCYISSDWGIALTGINNSNIFMTRNKGFAIEVNCTTKFNVQSNGNLYAQDIEANNLIIKSARIGSNITINESNGIVITSGNNRVIMNGSDGFKISNGSQDVFYVGSDGKLYARNFYTLNENGQNVEDIDGSFISDLTVNRLKTLTSTNRTNYVHIENNYLRFKTQDRTKLDISFVGSNTSAYPRITWGEGDGGGGSIAYQYKTTTSFATEYYGADGRMRAIELTNMANGGIVMTSPYGVQFYLDGNLIEINPNGIYANGSQAVSF